MNWCITKISEVLSLLFLLRFRLEKFAERRLRVARDDQDFLFRAALLFGFLHVDHDKLVTSRLGYKKVPRTGLEPVPTGFSHPIANRACLPISSTGAQKLSTEARGSLDAQLASAWFGPLSAALNPSSSFTNPVSDLES